MSVHNSPTLSLGKLRATVHFTFLPAPSAPPLPILNKDREPPLHPDQAMECWVLFMRVIMMLITRVTQRMLGYF